MPVLNVQDPIQALGQAQLASMGSEEIEKERREWEEKLVFGQHAGEVLRAAILF